MDPVTDVRGGGTGLPHYTGIGGGYGAAENPELMLKTDEPNITEKAAKLVNTIIREIGR